MSSPPDAPEAEPNRRPCDALRLQDRPFRSFGDFDPVTAGADRVLIEQIRGASGQDHVTFPAAGHFIREDVGLELAQVTVAPIAARRDLTHPQRGLCRTQAGAARRCGSRLTPPGRDGRKDPRMFKRRVMIALAAGGVAAAIPFLPATMSSAGGTDDVCLVEPIAGPPDSTAPPDSQPGPVDDVAEPAPSTIEPVTDVDAAETPTTDAAVDVAAAPTTDSAEVVDVTPTPEPAVEGDVTPTTEVADVAPTTEVAVVTVDSLPDLTTSAGESASGFRGRSRNVTAEPAPPPRQKIKFQLQFLVNGGGMVSIRFPLGNIWTPDPCNLWPGSTLVADRIIPGRYSITFVKLKGRDCLNRDVIVEFRGKPIPHLDAAGRNEPKWILTYNDKDEPVLNLYNLPADIDKSILEITMKCRVLVPRMQP